MPRTLSASTIAALESDSVRFVVLVKIEAPGGDILMTSEGSETVAILTTGWDDNSTWNDLLTWSDSQGGEVFLPGTLGGISEVEESQGAGGISLTFSGVDIATLSAAASPAFINSPVKVYLKVSAGTEGGVIMLFDGVCSRAPSISYGNNSTVTVSCQGKFAAMNRNRSERYSNADQQAKYPGDLGLEYAATVSSKEVIWPSSAWFRNNS